MLENKKGITLVSLVITIVIMLILAGVSINLIIGKNGLFTKSKDSVTAYENARNKENADLDAVEQEIKSNLSNKQVGEEILVGYWQTYDTSTAYGASVSKTMKLRDISDNYDIINISFIRIQAAGTQTNKDGSKRVLTLDFKDSLKTALNGYTVDDMKSDVKYKQSKGKKILLSIGGHDSSPMVLNTDEDLDNMVGSLIDLIDEYGVNGIDFDLESGINTTNYQNLEKVIRRVVKHYDDNLFLSINSSCTELRNAKYNDGKDGIWTTVSNDLADVVDLVSARYYNSGTQRACDTDTGYYSRSQGSPSFVTAQYERQMQCTNLSDKQLGITLLSYNEDQGTTIPQAYMTPEMIVKVINIIKTGKYDTTIQSGIFAEDASLAAAQQRNEKPYNPIKAYPNFRSVVIWNVGYDAATNYNMSNTIRNYIDNN